MKKTLPLLSFFRTVTAHPVASAVVEASAADVDEGMLKDLYYHDDGRLDGGALKRLNLL